METNPKDSIGRAKVPMSIFPQIAVAYGAIGILEGQLKYGAVNFRATPVAASVYLDAALRHLAQWRDGQEMCLEQGADGELTELGPHLGNALACIAIILDARMHGTLVDDRPISQDNTALTREMEGLRKSVAALQTRFGSVNPVHYTLDKVTAVDSEVPGLARWVVKLPQPSKIPATPPKIPEAPAPAYWVQRPGLPPVEKATVETVETLAKKIYEGWIHWHGYVPWFDGGNSDMQVEARRQARARLW